MSDPERVIRLDQFLKLAGCVRTGGEAKALIRGGHVRVNGEVDTRRSRKLRPGDEVAVGDFVAGVESADDEDADYEDAADEDVAGDGADGRGRGGDSWNEPPEPR